MTAILYYPLIDCDTEGIEKVAMFPTSDRHTVMAQSKMWLEETVSNYFRLCVRPGISANAVTIRCPRCGKQLRAISKPINETRQGLYICSNCDHKTKI